MGDAEPGRKTVRRGGLGKRLGTGCDLGQAQYGPLQVGCNYRRDDYENEQQESDALNSHETRSTEEDTAVGCPSRGAGGLAGRTFVTSTDESSRPTSEWGSPAARTSIRPAPSSRVVPSVVNAIRPSRQWTVISPRAWWVGISRPLGRVSRRTSSVAVFASVLDDSPDRAGPEGRTSMTSLSLGCGPDIVTSGLGALRRVLGRPAPRGNGP